MVLNDLLPMKTSYFRPPSHQILPICSLKYMKNYLKLKLLFLCQIRDCQIKIKWKQCK